MNRTIRRGLSMVELMIALSVTAIVGVATVGMLNAVSVGVDTRHDFRTATIRAHHAQARLAAYIAPSRCILHHGNNAIVLWLDDSRKNEAVNISEVRWLTYDADEGELLAHYVSFPDSMPDAQRAALDRQYPASSDWMAQFETYQTHSQLEMRSTKLTDGLTEFTAFLDTGSNAPEARHVTVQMSFATRTDEFPSIASAAIRRHRQPTY